MGDISVGGTQFSYHQESEEERTFMLVVTAETETAESTTHAMRLGVSSETAVTPSVVADRLADWSQTHPALPIAQWEVYERRPQASGQRSGFTAETDGVGSETGWTNAVPSRDGTTDSGPDLGGVDFDSGDTVEFYPAGSSSASVYGPKTGEVVDVAPGPDGGYCLVVETETGTTKVRKDWIIDDT